ncbi:hypothetical protein FJY90_00360 [Candidatus Gottesmanbacteria bacterium]|nr:hypothetical protein [Candidatus Gottesmanbacteria bacterium]
MNHLTQFIAHRVNTVKELLQVPYQLGIEVDLRDSGNKLYMHHDPFSQGEGFENYLKQYRHGTLILNIKSEGIEWKVLELLNGYSVNNFFFLDSSFPMILKLINNGEKRIALRFSELEGIDTISLMKGKAEWVWVDCFTKIPINNENYKIFKEWGFKICLVSPDLVGRAEDIPGYKKYLATENIIPDAICTKIFNIDMWK